MDAGSIERLELKAGERVTAAHVAQLDRAVAKNAGLPGLRVRRRVYPWGTSHSFYGNGGGLASAPVFRPDVTIAADSAEVRWSGPRALIGGLAPVLGKDGGGQDVEIFAEDAQTGLRPALMVPRTAFDPATLACGIYFKVTTTAGFDALRVEPVARAALPGREPFTAYKLALFLRLRDGQPSYEEDKDRELFCSQGFLAVQQRPNGRFEALFWAQF